MIGDTPGFADTSLIDAEIPVFEAANGLPPGGWNEMIHAKQGRLIDPIDIASAAVFLAGDESQFVNGIGLAVDGGFTSQLF